MVTPFRIYEFMTFISFIRNHNNVNDIAWQKTGRHKWKKLKNNKILPVKNQIHLCRTFMLKHFFKFCLIASLEILPVQLKSTPLMMRPILFSMICQPIRVLEASKNFKCPGLRLSMKEFAIKFSLSFLGKPLLTILMTSLGLMVVQIDWLTAYSRLRNWFFKYRSIRLYNNSLHYFCVLQATWTLSQVIFWEWYFSDVIILCFSN